MYVYVYVCVDMDMWVDTEWPSYAGDIINTWTELISASEAQLNIYSYKFTHIPTVFLYHHSSMKLELMITLVWHLVFILQNRSEAQSVCLCLLSPAQ